MNTKVCAHEFIDIRGAMRPEYTHHMLDAALSPLRIGRQPARSDRVDSWDER